MKSEPAIPIARRIAIAPIRFYQRFISPVLPAQCRFQPTCSEYARQAVVAHGPLRGGWLAIRRIGRCHPFHPGGYDPVPPQPGAETTERAESEERADSTSSVRSRMKNEDYG